MKMNNEYLIRLTGKAVFPGKKFSEVLKANKSCKIEFNSSKYQDVRDRFTFSQ